MTVLSTRTTSGSLEPTFLGGSGGLNRQDKPRHPFLVGLTQQQWSFFWRPEEIKLNKDSLDFRSLAPEEQHIFTSNLKRQILLDSVQGRAPSTVLGPLTSLPEMETWIRTWSMFEDIHSYSYRYILENVYSDTTSVYDSVFQTPEIMKCARDISHYYDVLAQTIPAYMKAEDFDEKDIKRDLWRCLNSINVLEGVRFYVSFACSWAFAEMKKMEGNAKIIKFICRDENLHLGATQFLIRALPKEDPDFAEIAIQEAPNVLNMFEEAVIDEKAWAQYLFKDGSMIGLNETLLSDYAEWIGARRCAAIGVKHNFKTGSNPLPWTQSWISGEDVQVAPQEVEVSSYTVGGVKHDLTPDTFKGFKL